MITPSDIQSANILIVDDQQANVILLEHMLSASGYRSVSTTMNPLEVCDLHRSNQYDLILLDLSMPQMDGFQVMEALKDIEADEVEHFRRLRGDTYPRPLLGAIGARI